MEQRKTRILDNFKVAETFTINMVCSGNIIRSPYAEILFEHMIRDIKPLKKIRIESSAVIYRNTSISEESRIQLLLEGILNSRIEEFTPRYFADYPDMYEDANLILVMAKNHLARIPEQYRAITFLLLEFTLGQKSNVPDPYFEGSFEGTYSMIKVALEKLVEIFSKLSPLF